MTKIECTVPKKYNGAWIPDEVRSDDRLFTVLVRSLGTMRSNRHRIAGYWNLREKLARVRYRL